MQLVLEVMRLLFIFFRLATHLKIMFTLNMYENIQFIFAFQNSCLTK